jgi:hypothetical protein
MATPKDKKELYPRGFFASAVQFSKPIKFGEYVLPEYFNFTAYFLDNDGKTVTKTNASNYKVWSVEFLIRVTKSETLEVITSTIKGATNATGHAVVSFGVDENKQLQKLQPVKPSYYKAIAENRARLMGFALTRAVQECVYKKRKDGSHYWEVFGRNEVKEEKLRLLAKQAVNNSYVRKDHAFYVEVARIYREAVLNGEWPNEVLKQKFPKVPEYSTKTVQGWTKVCREKGLLLDAKKPGKVSTVRKTVRKRKGGK